MYVRQWLCCVVAVVFVRRWISPASVGAGNDLRVPHPSVLVKRLSLASFEIVTISIHLLRFDPIFGSPTL